MPAAVLGKSSPTVVLGRQVRRLGREIIHTRASRVLALVLVVACISLADLYLTLTFLHGPGMSEGNPLARWIISHNNPWLLAGWKIMLLGVTTSALALTRKTRSGEIAAWVCVGVMLWLTGQWIKYAEKAPMLTPIVGQIADVHTHGPDWVRFSPRQSQ